MPQTAMQAYWIVNLKTKRYVATTDETFDGQWKENYPHTKGVDWLFVSAFSIWSDQTANGIPYTCELVRDKGRFMLLIDAAQHTKTVIDRAKNELRCSRDVVSLHTMKLDRV